MQTNPHSPIVTPASEDSSISSSSFDMLLLQIISKNAAERKERKRIDVSSKVITSEEWLETEKLRIENKEAKLKEKKNSIPLTSAEKEKKQKRQVKWTNKQ